MNHFLFLLVWWTPIFSTLSLFIFILRWISFFYWCQHRESGLSKYRLLSLSTCSSFCSKSFLSKRKYIHLFFKVFLCPLRFMQRPVIRRKNVVKKDPSGCKLHFFFFIYLFLICALMIKTFIRMFFKYNFHNKSPIHWYISTPPTTIYDVRLIERFSRDLGLLRSICDFHPFHNFSFVWST